MSAPLTESPSHMSLGFWELRLIDCSRKGFANSKVLCMCAKCHHDPHYDTGTLGQLVGHVLGHYLKTQGKPGAPAFTCQGFCWHNHGWPEAAWRYRRAWHLDEQVPLSFGGLHPGVAVHSQKPPQADSLLHVLKQIRNKRQGKGWLEPVT